MESDRDVNQPELEDVKACGKGKKGKGSSEPAKKEKRCFDIPTPLAIRRMPPKE